MPDLAHACECEQKLIAYTVKYRLAVVGESRASPRDSSSPTRRTVCTRRDARADRQWQYLTPLSLKPSVAAES